MNSKNHCVDVNQISTELNIIRSQVFTDFTFTFVWLEIGDVLQLQAQFR